MFAVPINDSPRRVAGRFARLWREEELMPTRLLAALAMAVGPVLVAGAAAGPARDVSHGKELFLRYCSGCHGVDGRGEAKTFQPNVGNLAVKELLDQLSDEYLFTAIKKGGAAVGKNAAMPAWQQQLDDSQIWDIVAFVRTFGSR
jgi:mono/diheme cytochrome c family protein